VVVNFTDELAGLVNLVGELAVHVVVDGLVCFVKLSLTRVELAGGGRQHVSRRRHGVVGQTVGWARWERHSLMCMLVHAVADVAVILLDSLDCVVSESVKLWWTYLSAPSCLS